MKLTSFGVQGFKNFTEEIVLNDLSDLNRYSRSEQYR